MTEAVVWNRMAHDGYLVRYYNDIIWIFEYLDDGLTKAGNKLFLDNPKGYSLWLKEKTKFQTDSKKELFKLYYILYCEFHKIYTIEEISEYIQISKFKVRVLSLLRKMNGQNRIDVKEGEIMGQIKLYANGGSRNHGCEAILRSTKKILDKDICVYSTAQNEDLENKINEIMEIKENKNDTLKKGSLKYYFSAINIKFFKSTLKYTEYTKKDFFRGCKKR